jgi:hypothetical protein
MESSKKYPLPLPLPLITGTERVPPLKNTVKLGIGRELLTRIATSCVPDRNVIIPSQRCVRPPHGRRFSGSRRSPECRSLRSRRPLHSCPKSSRQLRYSGESGGQLTGREGFQCLGIALFKHGERLVIFPIGDSYVASSQKPGAAAPLESALYLIDRTNRGVRIEGNFDGLGCEAMTLRP